VVGLVLGNVEELQGIPEMVALQPLGPQNGIGECNGDRRVVGAYESAFGGRLIFDFVQGGQATVGLPFEEFDPTVEALLAAEAPRLVGFDVGYATELI
jgi:hypothetical protein